MNRSTETTAHDHTARIARAAWLCAFVVPLILAALLLGVKSAEATPSPPGVVALEPEEEIVLEEELGFDEGDEAEDEAGFAEVECEIAREEAAEGEITTAEADTVCREAEETAREATAPGAALAAGCPLRSARPHATERRGRLKVTIGYTAGEAVAATIQLRSGKRGLGTFKRRLGRSGVLRFTRKLGGKRRGRHTTVRIRVASTGGGSCGLVEVVANKVV